MSRALLVVLGTGLAMFGAFVLALGGGGLLVAGGATTSSDTGRITTAAAALVIPPEVVSSRVADIGQDGPVTLRVTVRPRDPSRTVFAGVGPAGRVARMLAGTEIVTATALERSPLRLALQRTAGRTAVPPPPGGGWDARVTSRGEATLTWQVRPGAHRIVIMDAAGTPGLDVELRFRVDADPALRTVWTVLAITGGALLLAGLIVAAAGLVATLTARSSASTRP